MITASAELFLKFENLTIGSPIFVFDLNRRVYRKTDKGNVSARPIRFGASTETPDNDRRK